MIYTILIFIAIIFLSTTITYLVWNYFVVDHPPLQPEHNDESEINNARLSTCPTLTYAEAKSQNPRTIIANYCSICFVDYEEDGEDKALSLLPDCGHLFHATCVDPWLRRRQTCPACQSLVVNQGMQTSLAEEISIENEHA